MSDVTNVIVTAFACEEVDLSDLGLDRVEEHAGGTKFMEMVVYLGALNHCHVLSLIPNIRSRLWQRPECVQIFVNEQHDEKFTEVF